MPHPPSSPPPLSIFVLQMLLYNKALSVPEMDRVAHYLSRKFDLPAVRLDDGFGSPTRSVPVRARAACVRARLRLCPCVRAHASITASPLPRPVPAIPADRRSRRRPPAREQAPDCAYSHPHNCQ